MVTCWDLLALVCDVYCGFVTFPCGILVQVRYLIVSIPDLCCLSYFHCINTCKVPQIMFDDLVAMCSNSFLGTGHMLMHEVACITTILSPVSGGLILMPSVVVFLSKKGQVNRSTLYI